MASEEAVPTADEIKNQLARMLASKRFKAAKNSADFLELVVSRAVAGKKTTGAIIGQTIFKGKFKAYKSSDVRVTANTLRKKLSLYRENEGCDDPVIIRLPDPPEDPKIKLPEGEAYRPIVEYNPRAEIAKEYRLGVYFLSPKRPYELSNAMEHFKRVQALNSLHLGAQIGMIEASCLLTFTGWETTLFVSGATNDALRVISLGPSYWRTHAAAAAAWFVGAEIERAAKEFESALALDRQKAEQYGWYHAFLLATGQHSQLLVLAQRRANANPDDAHINALYGLFLYATRQFQQAISVLLNTVELDPNCWTAHLGLALVYIACGDRSNAILQLSITDHTLQQAEDHFFFPGLRGLGQAFLGKEYKPSVTNMAMEQLLSAEFPSPLQLALICIGTKEYSSAINYLFMGWFSYEPLILFLDTLPLFDPLREDERFQDIVSHRLSRRPRPANLSKATWGDQDARNAFKI